MKVPLINFYETLFAVIRSLSCNDIISTKIVQVEVLVKVGACHVDTRIR